MTDFVWLRWRDSDACSCLHSLHLWRSARGAGYHRGKSVSVPVQAKPLCSVRGSLAVGWCIVPLSI